MGDSEISVGIDVCFDTVKYYNLGTFTSEGDTSQSHISSRFAPIDCSLKVVLLLYVFGTVVLWYMY